MKKVMPLVFRIECNDVEDKYYPKYSWNFCEFSWALFTR